LDSLDTLREFLGWCTVINSALLLAAAAALIPFRGPISSIHGRMFGLGEADLSRAYFQYLAHYKIAILVFNLIPYVAVRLIETAS
jgi:hypothetical protein